MLNSIIISCVGCFVLPALGAATGVLWLDQVLRQTRIADYIYKIEEQVKEILDGKEIIPALNWEHEVKIDNIDSRNSKEPNQPSLCHRMKALVKSILCKLLSKKNGRFSPENNAHCNSDAKNITSRIVAFMNPNLFNYYAVLGILFLFPLFSFFLTFQILAPSKQSLVWAIVFIIVYGAFLLLSTQQIRSILKHGQHKQ